MEARGACSGDSSVEVVAIFCSSSVAAALSWSKVLVVISGAGGGTEVLMIPFEGERSCCDGSNWATSTVAVIALVAA